MLLLGSVSELGAEAGCSEAEHSHICAWVLVGSFTTQFSICHVIN